MEVQIDVAALARCKKQAGIKLLVNYAYQDKTLSITRIYFVIKAVKVEKITKMTKITFGTSGGKTVNKIGIKKALAMCLVIF